MAAYFLRTERLGFRRWADGDIALAVSLWGDPRVTRLIDSRPALTEDDVRQRLAAEIASDRAYGVQYWPIFLLKGDVFAGCCGLHPYQPSVESREVGVHILPAYWRTGIAFEAATAVVHHAIAALGTNRLVMGHHPANAASRRLIEKLGFRFSHAVLFAGTGLDHPLYVLEGQASG